MTYWQGLEEQAPEPITQLAQLTRPAQLTQSAATVPQQNYKCAHQCYGGNHNPAAPAPTHVRYQSYQSYQSNRGHTAYISPSPSPSWRTPQVQKSKPSIGIEADLLNGAATAISFLSKACVQAADGIQGALNGKEVDTGAEFEKRGHKMMEAYYDNILQRWVFPEKYGIDPNVSTEEEIRQQRLAALPPPPIINVQLPTNFQQQQQIFYQNEGEQMFGPRTELWNMPAAHAVMGQSRP